MADILIDNLTGEAASQLTAHTSDSGHTWAKMAAFTASASPVFDSTGGRVYAYDGNSEVLYSSAIATGAGEATVVEFDTLSSLGFIGAGIRCTSGRGYFAHFSTSIARLLRVDTGSSAFNQVTLSTGGASVPFTPTVGTHNIRLEAQMVGGNPVLSVYYDGVLLFTATDTHANKITTPGSPALLLGGAISGNTTGHHISRVTATDGASATGDTTAPTLSNPTAAANGATAASGSVTTNESGGTLYFIATANATENAAAVKAGSSQNVTASGVQNVAAGGLAPSSTLRLHYLHQDAAGNESAVATSTPFTTSAGSTPSITFATTTPRARQVHQRVNGVATVAVAGTYSGGTPSSIEARVVQAGTNTVVTGFDWAVRVASPSGGSFNFSLANVPAPTNGSMYEIQFRDSASPAGVSVSSTFGVGDLVLIFGQSNSVGVFRVGDNSVVPHASLSLYGNIGAWVAPAQATATGAITLGNALITARGAPVALLDYGIDGSGLSMISQNARWEPGTHTTYTGLVTMMTNGKVNRIAGAIWIQGETEGKLYDVATVEDAYYASLVSLISSVRADFAAGALIPFVIVMHGWRGDGQSPQEGVEGVKRAQARVGAMPGNLLVERFDVQLASDNLHHTATGHKRMAALCAQALNYGAGLASYYRGARVASTTRVDTNTVDVNLSHRGGSDFTPASGITGLRIMDGAAEVSITGAIRAAADRIRLTLSGTPGANLTIQHLYGANPAMTGLATDNSAMAMPMSYLAPAAVGAAISEGDVTAPTITGASVANASPSTVALSASESLDPAFVPPASAFTVAGHTVSAVTVAGGVINLSVSPAFANGEAARTVAYTKPASGGARDASGNLLESFSGMSVTNNVAASGTPITVTVTPATATVAGGGTQQFTANVAVNWTRSPAVGSVNSSGLFTAPAATASAQTITVTATSQQDGTKAGSATITIPAAASGSEMSFTPSPSRTLTVSPTSKALTGGPWWNLINPAKPRGSKDPQATLDITLNWGPWLADIGNPPIAKFTASIFGVTQVGAFAEGALTTMVFSGGTGAEASITFEIETDTTPPLKDERTVYIDLVNL